jgi:hypothetical protein
MKFKNLHVEAADFDAAAVAEAELERAADLTFSLRAVRPPCGKACARGQRLIDFIRGRFDSDSMQNVRHVDCSLLVKGDCVHCHDARLINQQRARE